MCDWMTTLSLTRIAMSNTGQNIIFLVGRSDDAWQISLNGGKMLMNRFSIDEDAAFELSGVYNLQPMEYPRKGQE